MDSNHQHRKKNQPFWLPALGPAIRLPQEKPVLSCRDRGFESISLQRQVACEPDDDIDLRRVSVALPSGRLRLRLR
jgi:hypothetical protein